MNTGTLTLLGVGDIILARPKPNSFFSMVAPTLKQADVVVGQGEFPFTARGTVTFARSGLTDMPFYACTPKNMSAFRSAGFNVVHLAGNHIWDAGAPGVEDTIKGFRELGIATIGAGMNLDEARKPAIIERKGTRFGFLDYNCVGPRETWASPVKPGCAYLHIVTAYDMDHPTPGAKPDIYTFPTPDTLKAMLDDIHKLRPLCDVLVVCFHKGIGFTPIKIAMYEQTISYAAIDAGADLILAEHAHILKGIEIYNGKAIFHGLCDFVKGSAPPKRAPGEKPPVWQVQQLGARMKETFGLETDPQDPSKRAPQPEALRTIIAKCTIDGGKISRVSYLPCLINDQGQPEILKHDKRGQEVFDYMKKITVGADLNARYKWDGDEVVIK